MHQLQRQFLDILGAASGDEERLAFLSWLKATLPEMVFALSDKARNDPAHQALNAARSALDRISDDIRTQIPIEAIFPSETIIQPSIGEDSQLTPQNCLHLDAFLYDEHLEDELVEAGKLSRAFCRNCGSKNTELLKFITHSCSKERLDFIFTCILPAFGLQGKVILDIGSRLGAVLYGAYYFTNASKIIGLEMNPEFCRLQERVIQQYNLGDRIEIVEGELTRKPDVVKAANVIVLNNVFGWFMTPEFQVIMWQFIRQNALPGTLLVTIPSLYDSLKDLNSGIEIDKWVIELNPAVPNDENNELEMSEVKLYQVMQQ